MVASGCAWRPAGPARVGFLGGERCTRGPCSGRPGGEGVCVSAGRGVRYMCGALLRWIERAPVDGRRVGRDTPAPGGVSRGDRLSVPELD